MADNKIRLYTQATVDLEFQDLPGDGTLNDRMFKYLVTIGGEGTLTDMLKQWHDGVITASPISAVLTPTMSTVYDGETVGDVTNWASFVDTANYSSTAGTIVSAVAAFTGDASAVDDVLADGETAGFMITVTDSAANERVFTANPIAITYAPAVNTVAPVASGDTSLGDTLSATNGTWTGATGGSYSYQWQRDGVDISGATASTYDIVAADDAADLRCVVTYTNSGGAVSANSNAVTVDDFAAPAITGSPTISGTEQVGQTLTATAASVTGTPTPSRTWQWVNSASGDISGATSSTYTLQASDEGDTITVRQTETNGLGSDTSTSAATGAIAAAPAVATITINSIGPQESSGDVPVDYTIDTNDSTVEVLLAAAATAAPAAADFGATAGGYTDLGTVNLTTSGSGINLSVPSGLDGSYKIHLLPTGGGDSDVASSAAVTIDTTAPAYASSTPADNGTDIAIDTTIAITFDEAIAAGTGTFVLYDITGAATVETFTVGGAGDNGGTISISTPTVTLTPGAGLSNSNAYSVRWTAGAITDAYSNDVAANSGDTLLNFTTVASSSTLTDQVIAAIGSKAVAIWDVRDFANLKQNIAGTTPVTAAGQDVKRLIDTSGNGNDIVTSTTPKAIAQTGYIDWNGADFRGASAFTGLTTDMELYAVIGLGTVDDTGYVLIGSSASGGVYTGHVEDGNTGSPNGAGVGGTIINTVNNVQPSPYTRNQLHDDMVAAGPYAVQGVRGFDAATIGASNMRIIAWFNSTIALSSRVKAVILCDALTSGERSSIQTIMAGA